jgi:hypothetical protein
MFQTIRRMVLSSSNGIKKEEEEEERNRAQDIFMNEQNVTLIHICILHLSLYLYFEDNLSFTLSLSDSL